MKLWLRIALLNFLLAAIFGVLMRYAFVEEISWLDYRNVLHAHSHGAMLGWIYLALYSLLIHYFLPEEKQQSKYYHWLFWITQLSVVGMFISFPRVGYAGVSIAFSTLHAFCSYAFAWRFLKDLKQSGNSRFSAKFVRASLLFMILSTFGVWALPVLMAKGMAGSAFYYASVQFYLHFQLNGWFIFAALGLFFFLLEKHEISVNSKHVKYFFSLLVVSCFMTYALAVTWSTPLPFLFWTNSSGVLIQLAALFFFLLIIRKLGRFSKDTFTPTVRLLMWLGAACFVLKILMQSAVVIPYIATVAYTIRNYVLGFLHLLLLGMMTCFLLGLATHENLLSFKNTLAKYGLYLLLAGLVLTELLLFTQGTLFWAGAGFIPKYYEVIFGASVLIPIGIGGMAFSQKW